MNLSEALAEIKRLEGVIDGYEGNGCHPIKPGTEHLWEPVDKADLRVSLSAKNYLIP